MNWVEWVVWCVLATTGWVGAQDHASPQKGVEVSVRQRTAPDRGRAMRGHNVIDVTRHTFTVLLSALGRDLVGHVTVLTDEETGLYWWAVQRARDAGEGPVAVVAVDLGRRSGDERWIVHFLDDRAVGVTYVDGVSIRETSRRERSWAAVEAQIMGELAHQGQILVKGGYLEDLVEIPLRAPGAAEFLSVPDTAAMPRPPFVVAVTWRDGLWTVTLQGPKDDYAEMLLKDHSYELVGFRLLGKGRHP